MTLISEQQGRGQKGSHSQRVSLPQQHSASWLLENLNRLPLLALSVQPLIVGLRKLR